jgi:hypothetical protein
MSTGTDGGDSNGARGSQGEGGLSLEDEDEGGKRKQDGGTK